MVTILAIDDDRNFLRALGALFAEEGYRVVTANDAESAIAKAIASRPDVIVTDYMMPGIDGAELCRRLKSNLATVRIPIVMLTALYPPPSVDEKLWDTLLTKPVPAARLMSEVRTLLSEAALADPAAALVAAPAAPRY
ncbi:response regulator receiver domain-containing protein [Trinickia symbiotica]|uniref:response regulator n=1 Tax=Trinickia symbiotica TaxID=863227 RepID=UPI0003807D62|nr:response regulator [Trinickia symbiotica]PPK44280.1 response regulator receiver domain-containing protein [Trinickia symbiotica]